MANSLINRAIILLLVYIFNGESFKLIRSRSRAVNIHSDFMNDISREKITIQSLAKSANNGSDPNQYLAASNFERDELLRTLSEINSKNVSWFQLTEFGQRRYAKSVMSILDTPSALDLVSSTISSSSEGFTLGLAAEGLWRITLSNEDIYKAWATGMQMFINISDTSSSQDGGQGRFEQIIQLPLPPTGFIPSRIKQVGTLIQNKRNGLIEYSFEKTIVTLLGRDWELPSFASSKGLFVPSGSIGVSYMDGKVWLDVRDVNGDNTRDSATASKFTAFTYIGKS
jgi:hypothetical protein